MIDETDNRTYTVRPFSKPARNDLKDVFRIYLSPSTLLLHKLRAGDACQIQNPGGRSKLAIAWTAPEKIQDTVVQTSKTLQSLYGLKLGDKISILGGDATIADVRSVQLAEVPRNGTALPYAGLTDDERAHWAWFLEHPLSRAEMIYPGMIFEDIELKNQRRSFKIESINAAQGVCALYRMQAFSEIHLGCVPSQEPAVIDLPHEILFVSSDGIGGLRRQLAQLNERLSVYNGEQRKLKLPAYYRPRRGGLILHGPPGTGKTLLLNKVAAAPWKKVLKIDMTIGGRHVGDSEAAVHRIFSDALASQPSVVIIDRLDTVAGKAASQESLRTINIAPSLCEELNRLDGSRVFVIAATNRLRDVDEALRGPGYFEFDIEMPIPDSKSRIEILKIISGLPRSAAARELEGLGDRTHGFVGADLDRLVQLSVDKAKARVVGSCLHIDSEHVEFNGTTLSNGVGGMGQVQTGDETVIEVTETDLNGALLDIRPTAMREVFLETPKVRWSDIGGQPELKRSLKQAVEWPFKYPTEMQRLGIGPKKGLLLYGPPGCSKTLSAKAVATEAGLNFIAVKGAELLSMYVGESERAMREVFRKARAASPSIIFFDEIDAIGASRNGSGQHGAINFLTTLLNELDGIELLKGVFVLAATNKPEILDPALMRPGRLDTVLYVGLPDLEARQEILKIRISHMDVCDDIAVPALAQITDGYSGAELVSICQKAGYAALEEQEQSGERQQINRKHFDIALAEVRRQVTPEMTARYEKWAASFRAA